MTGGTNFSGELIMYYRSQHIITIFRSAYTYRDYMVQQIQLKSGPYFFTKKLLSINKKNKTNFFFGNLKCFNLQFI